MLFCGVFLVVMTVVLNVTTCTVGGVGVASGEVLLWDIGGVFVVVGKECLLWLV